MVERLWGRVEVVVGVCGVWGGGGGAWSMDVAGT